MGMHLIEVGQAVTQFVLKGEGMGRDLYFIQERMITMRKVGIGIIVCMVSVLSLFSTIVFAGQVKLMLESYPPATLPTVSKIIDVSDPNDQLEISRQAMLFALSSEGWGLENFGGVMRFNEPPSNLGHLYSIVELIDASEILGFELNAEAIQYGLSMSGVEFHTDELVGRLSHDFCESTDNYGVISGIMGGRWQQCAVADWGGFSVEPIIIDFSTFKITEAKVKFKDNPNDDNFKIKGEFVLGDGNNGIDPINEDVNINLGTSSIVIQAPYSFVEDKAGVFKYKGRINSTDVEIEVKTKDYVTYNIKAIVKGTDLTDTSNPVDVGLTIGDDTGTATVRLKGELMFENK